MEYRYETHCHGSQCSACSHSTTQELVEAYHQAGFAGMVLTDHFIYGNTAVDRKLPWAERMRCYYKAYTDAREYGEKLDFDVIFGVEHAYGDGKEVLLYGIDLDFLLDNPDIPDLSLDEMVRRVHAYGGLAVQAHPYRSRWYINMDVEPRADLVDGIEVYNIGNQRHEDQQALELSRTGDFILTSGGDIHRADDPKLGIAGIALPYRVRNGKEFVTALKRRDHRCIIAGQIAEEIREEDVQK